MATTITYGSYSFPDPLPLVAEEDEAISLAGQYDHSTITVNLVGYLTGADLASLHLQKKQMISGFLNEYQDLTITVETESKVCPKAFVESLTFNESDITTFLPYSLSLVYYSGESFSDYFKIADPQDSWDFSEGENQKITATHTVSARGLKIGSSSELDNARYFVTGRLDGGFSNISMFNRPSGDAYLISRSENLDRKSSTYGVTETYSYSTSSDPIFTGVSGIVDVSTSIGYEPNQGLSVTIQGTVQGNIDANTGSVGVLSTGDFSLDHATEVALNAIVSSYSDYESGVYSFVLDGPTSYSYDLNSGSNTLGFSFQFLDAENLDIINGNVVHDYTTSITASKDSPVVQVAVNGNLRYRGADLISSTGLFETNSRFQALETAFATIKPEMIAKSAIQDFTGIATGYEFNSSYLNTGVLGYNVTKNPIENTISYSYNFNNQIDLSNGDLENFTINIQDKKPLQLTNVQETISGYHAQNTISRTLGEYSVSAQSNNGADDLQTLKNITSGFCSGLYIIEESFATGENNISYNLSKHY